MTNITHLRTENLTTPLGLDAAPPRLSWQMHSTRQGARQTAYQILASSPSPFGRGARGEGSESGGEVWDSGKIPSSQSVYIPYGGELISRQRVEWRVRVWDETGAASESDPAAFEVGLLASEDWRARWIEGTLAGGPRTSVPCPYLRKEFNLGPSIAHARLYITALGVYEAWLNGQRVSADWFNPGWTDYRQRILYHTYDITSLLQAGPNALGAILGDGWYCGYVGWIERQHYGDRPRLLAQLEITYADGSTQTVASDETWQHAYGPLLASDILMGEDYDARREFPGWHQPRFDASGWSPVRIAGLPGGKLQAASVPPVRATQEIRPVSLTRVEDWPHPRWVFDLGQNMVGHVRLKVSGKAGQTFTLRHAEALLPDPPSSPHGVLYTIALRNAKATDHYTCKGEGEETWEPRFTFHGFRYVEVTGCDAQPSLDLLTGVVVHSDLSPGGSFACSEPLLNRLQENIRWSQRGNFLSIPTDCPQRDERLGWTGDAQVFAPTAAFNMDVEGFFASWLRELALAQWPNGAIPMVAPDILPQERDGGPAWADALLIISWAMYQAYGDTRTLHDLYPAYEKFVGFLSATSPGLVRGAQGWQGHGDWLSLGGDTPKDLIGTAFFAHSADLLSRIAAVLGKQADEHKYRALFEEVRRVFVERFVLAPGVFSCQTQTAYALALQYDLLPEAWRAHAVRELVKNITEHGNHLSTGFVGTPHLLFALSENGQLDTAYTLLLQRDYPSWLYPVTQGATTIWERWDGFRHDRGFQSWTMNSFNHYAYGAVGSWMYQVIGGIRPDPQQPGFQHFILKPQPGGGLTHARAVYPSAYGEIASEWKLEGERFTWKVVIPANTSALVVLPFSTDPPQEFAAGEYEFSILIALR